MKIVVNLTPDNNGRFIYQVIQDDGSIEIRGQELSFYDAVYSARQDAIDLFDIWTGIEK